MKVLHISTECYPAAKAGGMGDVVGALPLYLPKQGVEASVIIPKYANAWISDQSFETVFESSFDMAEEHIVFRVQRLDEDKLGFPFYVVDIPGKFDRANVYLADDGEGFRDEIQRNISFQRAIVDWLLTNQIGFDILHCHDHMTGLIPFILQQCPSASSLKDLPVFFTIHNGQYRGVMPWSSARFLPEYDGRKAGLLDWDGSINCLAAALKSVDRVSTVSPSYMAQLQSDFDTLTSLARAIEEKSIGILNGIDAQVWDPKKDPMLYQLLKRSPEVFKSANKKSLAADHGFRHSKCLVSFIGRFAYEKGADLLPGAISRYLEQDDSMQFFILGSGDRSIEEDVLKLQNDFPDNVVSVIAYNEGLAHKIYAASDFILMPSRFEPCGLNQMYAMRYGTVPVVRHTGGLIDTVPDIGDGGNGISFLRASEEDIVYSLGRVRELYDDSSEMKSLVSKIMSIDNSWTMSARKYTDEYQKTIKEKT